MTTLSCSYVEVNQSEVEAVGNVQAQVNQIMRNVGSFTMMSSNLNGPLLLFFYFTGS